MNQAYTGCWTALVTPFGKDFAVDWESLKRNVDFQIEEGINGILPMGTTGESATVAHGEHAEVIARVAGWAAGKTNVLAGTGSNSTDEAIHETKLAVNAGVKTCLLVDCYYNKPSSLELRKEYYGRILSAFPETEFIAYAIPGRSVTVILPEDLAILRSEHPNLVAVKEATGDFERMKRTRTLLPEEFNIFSGDDPNTTRMMTDTSIGACGVISVISNITPASIVEMTRLLLNGKTDEAAVIDEALKPLFQMVGVATTEKIKLPDGSTAEVTYKFPNPVPIKTMMAGVGMMDGRCKPPMGKLTKGGVKKVREGLKQVWRNYPKALEPIAEFYDVDVAERLDKDKYWKPLSY
ncbi:4-hydroxy-tetrahydrodipicolinate synthase [uncultured archaeon]|nr:4-hydroxy-tetrahydrodipicolinate synthase [uncultured archaeon]